MYEDKILNEASMPNGFKKTVTKLKMVWHILRAQEAILYVDNYKDKLFLGAATSESIIKYIKFLNKKVLPEIENEQ